MTAKKKKPEAADPGVKIEEGSSQPAERTLSIREQLAIKNQEVMEQLTVCINKLHEAETFAKGNGRPFLHIFSSKQRISAILQQYKVNSK